eukprot:gnl/MRDRNA2_/MRDRNA2_80696_c0_seq1.p1 gnl/MRDRNA2_/MRDRNA2_80696_c0~~gnl/MRDRNA2_/MRDRNA2_80696_c0_seq1.p1  ORF type:complete len:491 (-),score=91.60 gnl/MRDRNA2_/MRDRNA2_80696_c0_seq1:118-1590(-)
MTVMKSLPLLVIACAIIAPWITLKARREAVVFDNQHHHEVPGNENAAAEEEHDKAYNMPTHQEGANETNSSHHDQFHAKLAFVKDLKQVGTHDSGTQEEIQAEGKLHEIQPAPDLGRSKAGLLQKALGPSIDALLDKALAARGKLLEFIRRIGEMDKKSEETLGTHRYGDLEANLVTLANSILREGDEEGKQVTQEEEKLNKFLEAVEPVLAIDGSSTTEIDKLQEDTRTPEQSLLQRLKHQVNDMNPAQTQQAITGVGAESNGVDLSLLRPLQHSESACGSTTWRWRLAPVGRSCKSYCDEVNGNRGCFGRREGVTAANNFRAGVGATHGFNLVMPHINEENVQDVVENCFSIQLVEGEVEIIDQSPPTSCPALDADGNLVFCAPGTNSQCDGEDQTHRRMCPCLLPKVVKKADLEETMFAYHIASAKEKGFELPEWFDARGRGVLQDVRMLDEGKTVAVEWIQGTENKGVINFPKDLYEQIFQAGDYA